MFAGAGAGIAAAFGAPLTGAGHNSFVIEGRPVPGDDVIQDAVLNAVTPGYFRTMRIALKTRDERLQALLDLPAEVLAVEHVDAPVHEAEAVRRAHDGIDAEVQDGAVVDADAVEVATPALPRLGQGRLHRREDDLHATSLRVSEP